MPIDMNYDVRSEEEKKRREEGSIEDRLRAIRSTADEHISEFSSYAIKEIDQESDPVERQKKMMAWVRGLMSLYHPFEGKIDKKEDEEMVRKLRENVKPLFERIRRENK